MNYIDSHIAVLVLSIIFINIRLFSYGNPVNQLKGIKASWSKNTKKVYLQKFSFIITTTIIVISS